MARKPVFCYGIHMVAAAKPKVSRYARGIRSPDPDKIDAIRLMLESSPSITKKDLARAVNLSRTSLTYYLRHMQDELDAVSATHEDVRYRRVLHHIDLLEGMSTAATEVREEIAKLRAKGANPTAILRGTVRLLLSNVIWLGCSRGSHCSRASTVPLCLPRALHRAF